jgi:hypothetical protein
MENYYNEIQNFLKEDLLVYPNILGRYEWKLIKNSMVCYEINNDNQFVRCSYVNNSWEDDSKLSYYGKFVKPKTCTKESVIKILQRMDDQSYCGTLIVRDGAGISFIKSYKNFKAHCEFTKMLNQKKSIEDILNMNDDDIEKSLFYKREIVNLIQESQFYGCATEEDLISFIK